MHVAALDPTLIGIIAASAVAVVLLLVVLLRRGRSRADHTPEPLPPRQGSFLDQPLTRGFEGLGKPVTQSDARTGGAPGGLPFDRAKDMPAEAFSPAAPAPSSESAGGLAPVVPLRPSQDDASDGAGAGLDDDAPFFVSRPAKVPGGGEAAQVPASSPAAPDAVADDTPPAPQPTAEPHASPLSDILVTTADLAIDLDDPEVRALLADLVRDEIRLAEAYRREGQVLDAVLQLTEAEKACVALGMADEAERIRALLAELRL